MRRLAVLLVLAAGPVGLTACSESDAATPGPTVGGPTDDAPVAGGPGVPAPTTAAPMPSAPPPETGVPGLDSDDAFCAAWARYAGSYQVVAVASFFLTDQPERVFELEIAAAPVVTEAYAAMQAAWPAELDAERDTALTGTFGPFAARAMTSAGLLTAAGADPAVTGAIAAAWVEALATRNPEAPDVTLELDSTAAEIVRAAAVELAATVPPVPADPSLVIDLATPLTDAYIAANCPDEGQLAGNDVTG